MKPRSHPRLALLAAAWLAGCASPPQADLLKPALMPELRRALEEPTRPPLPPVAAPAPAPVAAPAVRDELPAMATPRPERRFSVVLNGATPEVVFMALLNETPLSVAVEPGVKGPMSIALRDVTLREALDLVRELHQVEYKVIGRHIVVSAAQMQTRLYKVNYPAFDRQGRSELRVLSGSITGNGGSSQGSNGSSGGSGNGGSGSNAAPESSRVTTAQKSNLWQELEAAVKLMVGDKDGRQVIVSPQSGTVMVRAMPRELRAVSEYLEAARIAVERQVMLEAKVVEVQLRDSERMGINWAAFKAGVDTRGTIGVVSPGGSVGPGTTLAGGLINVTPGAALEVAATATGSILGLAFQTANFASVLEFLGTQGHTQVLSSPRIATLNNQKAVLKVGTDDFFVTSISTTTTPVGNTTSTTPSIGVTPFFSGISLDVTPSIADNGAITLHIRPAVSQVTERNKVLNLGTMGTYSLPLASSDINESDAVVRAMDGQIIAIGGLMRQTSSAGDSGIPGAQGTVLHKVLGGQATRLSEKRELVILLKPTLIDPGRDDPTRADALQRLLDWTDRQPPAQAALLQR